MEGWREGGREVRREEGWRDGGREVRREEGWRDGGKEGGREEGWRDGEEESHVHVHINLPFSSLEPPATKRQRQLPESTADASSVTTLPTSLPHPHPSHPLTAEQDVPAQAPE